MAPPNKVEAPITVLDLFSGCGGLSEGFHQFRPETTTKPVFRTIGAVEWEPAAAASYAMNFGAESSWKHPFDPPEVFCGDITDWEPKWQPGEVDVIVGGPPCQGFSGLNRDKVRAERNQLWQEFIRVVVALQPKVFVIENVDRFVRSVEFTDLQERIGSRDLTNYRLSEPPGAKAGESDWDRAGRYVLNAADYGARQARRRAIVVGVRTDINESLVDMEYPKPTHSRPSRIKGPTNGKRTDLNGRFPWQTVDKVFAVTASKELHTTELPSGRITSIKGVTKAIAGPYLTSELHIARRPEPVSLARYSAIPENGNRKHLRGRYLCRLENGAEFIIEKAGIARNEEGKLNPLGIHNIVRNGVPSSKTIFIQSYCESGNGPVGSKSRIGQVIFDVEIRNYNSVCRATVEYLSTRAWDDHDAGAGDVMGRVRLGEPSVTIRTEFFKPEKGRYLHPTEDRPITHYEAAKLQGFPDNFRWCGSKTDIAKQIGNAVPIPLGRHIASSVYAYLRPRRD
ncbi:DNA cytosine methyltransferase [Paenarthrobacter sp. CC6]|uniref:DNA cytosine methyltransferase n=1 Tax=Paenarthrobacter sp. CC6 TaxID=3029184 RepID=UPI00339C2A7E